MFAGPGKTDGDLTAAVGCGVLAVNAESPGEVERLSEVCRREKKLANVAFRLAADAVRRRGYRSAGTEGELAGSPAVRHGPDASVGRSRLPAQERWLRSVGIHCHFASGILDGSAMARSVETVVANALPLALRYGLSWINFGGGLGIPVYEDDRPLDLSPLRDTLRSLAGRFPAIERREVRLAVESGRYLVGTCGYYVCRVVDVKVNQGRKFVVLDGGVHHDLFRSSVFRHVGRATGLIVCGPADGPVAPAEVVGRLCTPIDRLGSRVNLPNDVGPGVRRRVPQRGGLSKYASPLNFLGHDWPAEVLVDGTDARLISRRVSLAEVMELQTPVPGPAATTQDPD